MTTGQPIAMSLLQQQAHGVGHDYILGSPHLQHAELNAWLRDVLNGTVNDLADRHGRPPRVLEVGAGHGPFTETLVAAGAEVVVTEMSRPSAEHLAARFRNTDRVRVHHDPDGDLSVHGHADLVVYVSVLHHIPDYLASLDQAVALLSPGGAIVSLQDPLWYPRRSTASMLLDRGAYLGWRVTRGDLVAGAASLSRRLRGAHDETEPRDMSEYHGLRDGVDEQAVVARLRESFDDVELTEYWSSQAGWAHRLGARLHRPNTFGVVATGRR